MTWRLLQKTILAVILLGAFAASVYYFWAGDTLNMIVSITLSYALINRLDIIDLKGER